MKTENTDTSHGLQNADDDQHKQTSTKIITNEPIENTPFRIIGGEDKTFWVTFGIYKVGGPYTSVEDAKEPVEWIGEETWTVLLNVLSALVTESRKSLK